MLISPEYRADWVYRIRNCFKEIPFGFLASQILLVQSDVPDLEDLRASAAGDKEQVLESRESW